MTQSGSQLVCVHKKGRIRRASRTPQATSPARPNANYDESGSP